MLQPRGITSHKQHPTTKNLLRFRWFLAIKHIDTKHIQKNHGLVKSQVSPLFQSCFSSFCGDLVKIQKLFWVCFKYEPGSKLLILGMVIPPLIRNPSNGYINPYRWVDDHPLLYGKSLEFRPQRICLRYLVGGFNFQPIWKILVKLDHFPRDRDGNKTYLKPPPTFGPQNHEKWRL